MGDGPLALGLAVPLVDVDEVDVGGEVELARAELPHGEGAESRAGLAPGEAGGRAVAGAQAPIVEADRRVEAGGGERGQVAGDLAHPRAAEVAQGDPHHLVGAQAPQQAVEAFHVVRREATHRALEQAAQLGLRARALQERGAGGAPQQRRVAREERGHHARAAGQQDEGGEQVALRRERPGAVHEALDAGEGEVGVRREADGLRERVQPLGEALAQAREPLGGLRRARVGGPESGDDVLRTHRRPPS